MGIEVTGVQELAGRLTNAQGRIDKETRDILRREGIKVRARMKQIMPKAEGDMARAVTMRSRGTRWSRTVVIGPEFTRITPTRGDNRGDAAQRYPIYQEYGTARMAAQPFVKESMDGSLERLTAALNALIPRLF